MPASSRSTCSRRRPASTSSASARRTARRWCSPANPRAREADPVFADRLGAGRQLAGCIAPRLAGQRARIYGLARGGVIVGRSVADGLGLALEVLIACKVGAPGQLELAVGAGAQGR